MPKLAMMTWGLMWPGSLASGSRPPNAPASRATGLPSIPDIGFAKTADQSLELLRRLSELGSLGRPIVVGVSRKSFLGAVTAEHDVRRRLPGSLAAGLFALLRGAAILRVHDVAETIQAIKVWQALVS